MSADAGEAASRGDDALLLSGTATALLKARAPAEIYSEVGARVHGISGAFIVAVSSFEESTRSVRAAHLVGAERALNMARRLGFGDLPMSNVPLDVMTESELRDFTSGRLCRLEGGIYALSGRMAPRWFCTLVENTFRIRSVHGMGFSWEGRLFGGVSLLMRTEGEVPRRSLIEAVVQLGAVALQRVNAEEERGELRERLLQSQKMEAVGRLAGGIAHDFNSLLTVVSGYGDTLLASLPEDSPMRQDVREILRAAGRASDLTRQLLSFSSREIVQPTVLRPGKTIQEMADMLRGVVRKSVALSVEAPDAEPPVRMDGSQFTQIMIHLAENAGDAMPRGGKLSIRVVEESMEEPKARNLGLPKAGDYAGIVVRDTGTGMDAETASRVFEPFFTTKQREKGAGLGLATVYAIVRQAGGTVVVDSRPGKGSTFTVWLPAAAAEAAAGNRPGQRLVSPARPGSILVAEDNESVRGFIEKVLLRAGYSVQAAGDGAEALEVLAGLPEAPDLVITDLVMPGMGGRELAERIRQAIPGIGILFISGYTEDDVMRQGIDEGSVDFLRKPFQPAELLSRTAEILARAHEA